MVVGRYIIKEIILIIKLFIFTSNKEFHNLPIWYLVHPIKKL